VFRWAIDVERGDWIRDRLGPFGGQVSSVMPRGFEAYARVLHRATGRGVERVRWAEVAASAGTVLHATAQWSRVARRPGWSTQEPTVAHDEPWPADWYPEGQVGRRGEPREWPGGNPMEGELDQVQLPALVDVLRPHTHPDAVTAAFWVGSSWEGSIVLTAGVRAPRTPLRGARIRRPRGQAIERFGPALYDAVLAGPQLELPNREYYLFAGSLDDVADLADGSATADVTPFAPGSRTPSLLWPDDRTWCVATEVDFDSTLVGGPRALVDAVLADETLEAFEVIEADSLAYDGDEVN